MTDNLGATEGIGSRFFAVSNGVSIRHHRNGRSRGSGALALGGRHRVAAARAGASLRRTTGLGSAALHTACIRIDERREISWYAAKKSIASSCNSVRARARAIPGTCASPRHWHLCLSVRTLDKNSGLFAWAPGVGFVGTYDLVFVRWQGARAVERREVRIVLQPKGRGTVGPQVVIDTPRSQQDLAQPFTLAG